MLRVGSMVSLCFFSSRRRHTRCALVTGVQTCALPILNSSPTDVSVDTANRIIGIDGGIITPSSAAEACRDRTSVVQGTSVSVRVDLGGRRITKKHTPRRIGLTQQSI